MTADEWRKAEKKTDRIFEGSVFQGMGMSDKLCPSCDSHLSKSEICLNACHLGDDGMERFAAHLRGLAQ